MFAVDDVVLCPRTVPEHQSRDARLVANLLKKKLFSCELPFFYLQVFAILSGIIIHLNERFPRQFFISYRYINTHTQHPLERRNRTTIPIQEKLLVRLCYSLYSKILVNAIGEQCQ